MSHKTYYQSDKLQKLINWEVLMDLPRYAGGHDDQMKNLFKEASLVAHWNERDYQGMVATCVKLEDGRYVIYNDYYGSCSGCDAWEDASDAEVRYMCVQLANSAYIFRTMWSVLQFLDNPEEGSEAEWNSWHKPAKHLRKEIVKMRKLVKLENKT